MKVPVRTFIKYAGTNIDRWNQLVGRLLRHPDYGDGDIYEVEVNGKDISIRVIFTKKPGDNKRCFGPKGLIPVEAIDFPEALAKQILQFEGISVRTPPKPVTRTVYPGATKPNLAQPTPIFQVNQIVCLSANRSLRGRIVKARFFSAGEWNYDVSFSENEPVKVIKESNLVPWAPQFVTGTLNDLLCDLAMVKLRKALGDTLYALYASRTKFEVYQFKPALKFLANPDQRLLIADEVGLGKTIEAGIIYLELQARLDVDRVLIVCPSSLRQKWQDEMKARFDEEFVILDSQGARHFLDQVRHFGDSVRLRGIISLELIRRRDLAEAFTEIKLDLVIIDEAHHCRNTDTLANAVASVLTENSDAALLLTATPLQMGQEDLFHLLNILSPGEFDNLDAFIERLEPNQHINRAAQILATGNPKDALKELRLVEKTSQRKRFSGNPYYLEIVKSLSDPYPQQQTLISAQRRLIELNTLSSVFTRTRKRDIAEKVPKRTAYTLPVNFTPEEKRFYNQVLDQVHEEYYQSHRSGAGSGFITIMRERQVASCISAYIRRQNREIQEVYPEDESFESNFIGQNGLEESDNQLNGSSNTVIWSNRLSQGKPISAPTRYIHDSKFEVFWAALQKVLAEDPKTKVLVFSFFRDTINYLEEALRKRQVEVRAIHGGYKVLDRYAIIEQFRDKPEIRVLISSDVGSEGLDFQFCDTLFNYDLPWNPMKVEQRIGRIDRFGQESPRVRIYNLSIEDSIESRILMRLYDRIEIFTRSIGDIEAILGEQIRILTESIFSKKLTSKEEIEQAEKTAENIIKRKQEMEEFEQKKLQFLGQEAIFNTTIEKTIESGRFVSDVEIKALVGTYVHESDPLSRLESNGPDDASYCLRANDTLSTELKTFIFQKRKNDLSTHDFLQKLQPGKEIPLTFSSDLAFQRKLLEFINPRHPLAQAALDFWKQKSSNVSRASCLRLRTDIAPAGNYCFYIFSFNAEGIDKDTRIVPIVVRQDNGDVHILFSKQFLRLVQTSAVPVTPGFIPCDSAILDQAEESAMLNMANERDALERQMRESNEAMLNARLSAVEQSYRAKKRRVETIRQKVSNASIVRMYESQLKNLEAKYKAKTQEIRSKSDVQVSFTLELRGFVEVIQ